MSYPTLFSPIAIGSMLLPNRIVMGSMHLGYEGHEHSAERMAEFYAARAKGQAALIITGGCAINAEAIGGGSFSSIYNEEDLRTLGYVTSRVHDAGGKIGLQLFHAGRYATREWLSGLQPVAPSAIRSTLHSSTPREMDEADIHRTIADFATAAARAREVGFDCIEIMGSEGYLINQFFSPVTNKRNDEWGGSLENRIRFGAEVMAAVRKINGRDFPVIFRMSGLDLIPNSNGWEETFAFAKQMQQEGADALNIGIGWHESRIPTISMLVPRGYYSFAVERIRRHVSIPCICSNRINDPDLAENLLATEKADLVSLARPLLADPDFAAKAATGRTAFINTCIACNQACLDNAFRNQATTCILNPAAGREHEMRTQPARYKKRVAVVGAGPAGLEASKALSERGHRVTLFERATKIGGQLLHAVLVPGKEEFLNTLRYYQSYLEEYRVEVILNCSPSSEDLQSFDAVIVAAGARPRQPDIPGWQQPHCSDYESFFNDRSFVQGAKTVAVVGAGGIGCDVAHLLAEHENAYPPSSLFDDPNRVASYEDHMRSLPRKHEITLMRRGKRVGEKLGPTTRWALIQLLECRGVRMLTQLQYHSITSAGLHASGRNEKEIFVPAEKVIFAVGQIRNSELYQRLQNTVEQCYLIGAARLASETNAQAAIWEAAEVARQI